MKVTINDKSFLNLRGDLIDIGRPFMARVLGCEALFVRMASQDIVVIHGTENLHSGDILNYKHIYENVRFVKELNIETH